MLLWLAAQYIAMWVLFLYVAERVPIIYKGPPSTIVPGKARTAVPESVSAPAAPASGPSRVEPAIRAARNQVTKNGPCSRGVSKRSNVANNLPTTSRAWTRMRKRASAPSIAETGRRDEHDEDLVHEDLWTSAARLPTPPPSITIEEYHECSICRSVKSHPVSYECGHSDCYVCIRLWLEKAWTCPHCEKIMERAPTRHRGEEASIRHDYPHTTSSAVFSCSADDRRQWMRVGTVGEDAGPSNGPLVGRFWQDDLPTNEARRDPAFTYSLGQALSAMPDEALDDGIQIVSPPVARDPNSDRPLHTWYPHRDECTGVAEYRCVDQQCAGEMMMCANCIVVAHAQLPTHFIELGHPVGQVCPFKHSVANDFVLYDLSGVHEIAVDYCGCRTADEGPPLAERTQLLRACWWPATVRNPNTCASFAVLRFFQILNCLGKLSAYDFLRGLEMCTNHDGLDKLLDRRKPFMHIMRQYRETKRLKRGKRGHKAGGAKATEQGELMVKCRVCPQPGWNLLEGWENAPPGIRFIYFLFLAMDANFRLSNRNVSSEVADPILGDGWGYFCKREGDDGYKAHILKHVNDKEVSNCSGFQAMFMANTRRVKGLRTTGIGGVTCSRHNMWCANGIGDLQMGEQYCNMDFLFLAALMRLTLLYVIASYDIACQFAIHFYEWMGEFPESMRLRIPPANVWWKVPNFHLPAHKPPCHAPYSFHWMWGAGMTHGEGVEQNWSFSNGAAALTRLMGPGSRQAMLEDVFGFHNYDRQLAMHHVLPRRLAISMKEGAKHNAAFESFTASLEELRPAEVTEWREWRWEAKQHTDSSESPFELAEEARTLRDIQLQIVQEEYLCMDDSVEVEQEHSPGMFIAMGLDLKEQQLEIDVKALKDPSVNQKLAFTKRRTAMLKRIYKFREVQRIYMPALHAVLSDEQKQMYNGNGEQLPEATRLFMPSDIENMQTRGRVCAIGLAEVEARMREGEAGEALDGVRQGLRTWTMTNRFKLRNFTGQGMLKKGQGILRLINIKIHRCKLRYQYARAALLGLRGHGSWEERLRMLNDDDMRALNEHALTEEEKAQNDHWAELGGAIIEGGITRAAGLARGEGSHTLSWIWYTVGVTEDDDDPRLHDALRVEWCKAYSRARRYDEDVRHLREEMCRTVASGYSEAHDWEALALEELPDASPELTEGRRAYATEHAVTERDMCVMLERNWTPILAKADRYLAGGAVLDTGGDLLVTLVLSLEGELDPEDKEARLEGEEEVGPGAVSFDD
ncbi:hypothetical protein FB451DRAFT_1416695 [Mycena latifolia]|nr:hypothetical protein FB451DRAFT_1416695 [Mycena latifolia]